jgi:hypothetical protein
VGLRLLGPTERWLVAVYADGVMGVWDLGAGAWNRWLKKPEFRKRKQAGCQVASHLQPTSRWTSFEAAFQPSSTSEVRTDGQAVDGGCIYIAVNESL